MLGIMRETEQMTSDDENREKLIANGCVISSLCYLIVSTTIWCSIFVGRLVEKGIIVDAINDHERSLLVRLITDLGLTCGTLNMTTSFALLCIRNPKFREKVAEKLKIFKSFAKDKAQNPGKKRIQGKNQFRKEHQSVDVAMNQINKLPGNRNNSSIDQQIQMRKLIIKQYGAAHNNDVNSDKAEVIAAETKHDDGENGICCASIHQFNSRTNF